MSPCSGPFFRRMCALAAMNRTENRNSVTFIIREYDNQPVGAVIVTNNRLLEEEVILFAYTAVVGLEPFSCLLFRMKIEIEIFYEEAKVESPYKRAKHDQKAVS
jgi:hypothetical protein